MSEVRNFKLGAYATGDYFCHCISCGAEFIGDKRALECMGCAAAGAADQIATLQAELSAERETRERLEKAGIDLRLGAINVGPAMMVEAERWHDFLAALEGKQE